jgi:adenylate kinase
MTGRPCVRRRRSHWKSGMIYDAWLLIGPTGSGKTPLGELLERAGWKGRRCVHFDFGAELRRAGARPEEIPELSAAERDVVRDVLSRGVLLEERHFPIAGLIFRRFLREKNAAGSDLLVLNGWPRHLGQARDLEKTAAVARVVVLAATPATIRERIRTDAAGDRAEREDDSPADIEGKFALYAERTEPLAGYYAAGGVPITTLGVGPSTSAGDLVRELRRILNGGEAEKGGRIP